MKRMNEVFELPIDHKKLEMYGAGGLQGVPYHVAEEHAAHAINNVDALADALEALLPHVESNRELGKSGESAHAVAQIVLNAYRGEK